MNIDLEKVDAVIERTGVSYKEAKEALEKANGDVLEAIVILEETDSSLGAFTKNVEGKGEKVLEKLKELLKEGNVNKITIKKDEETVASLPINAGVLGFALAPWLATIGITAAVVTKHTIEITKKDGEVIDLREASENTIQKAKSSFMNDNDTNDTNDEDDSDLN